MSKSKTKKKVVKKKSIGSAATKIVPTTARRGRTSTKSPKKEESLLFEKSNYTFILIGLGLVFLGMIMMLGGSMPDADTWDPDIIYSTRITVFGPLLILTGLAIEIYAIFLKK